MRDEDARLKLRAKDLQGLTLIASALQDALVPMADMRFEAEECRFLMVVNRFHWESPRQDERSLAGLRFDHVTNVQTRGLDALSRDRILGLLTISHDVPEPGKQGHVVLHFSGGGAIRLTVEKLACALEDLTEPWPTPWRPDHQGNV